MQEIIDDTPGNGIHQRGVDQDPLHPRPRPLSGFD
ncbi:hypothetical protein QE411_002211 [Microbacterium arborescens]|nr:hypothetical protein [Microbacterium arborescens]